MTFLQSIIADLGHTPPFASFLEHNNFHFF